MKLIPMPGYVIAKPIELKERQTSSGIVIPKGQKVRGRLEETQQGEVVDSCYLDEQVVCEVEEIYFIKPGDRIIYGEYAGFESDIDGQRYRFLKIEDVRAKIIQ